MRRELLATLLSLFLLGCEPPPQAQPSSPSAPPPPPGSSPAGATAASELPAVWTGVWTQTQVEDFLREEFAITTFALKSTASGYQGTGTDINGIAYTFVVKQVSGGIKVDWTTSTGNGQITFGNPVP